MPALLAVGWISYCFNIHHVLSFLKQWVGSREDGWPEKNRGIRNLLNSK